MRQCLVFASVCGFVIRLSAGESSSNCPRMDGLIRRSLRERRCPGTSHQLSSREAGAAVINRWGLLKKSILDEFRFGLIFFGGLDF